MEALKWGGFAPQEVGGGWEGTLKVAEQWIRARGKCSLVSTPGVRAPRCGGSHRKESACSLGDPDSIPSWEGEGQGRFPGERNGYPLQESHGQRSLAGSTIHGVAKSRT